MLIVCGPRDEGLCDRFHVSRPLSALSEQTTALVHTCESQLRNLAQKTCTAERVLVGKSVRSTTYILLPLGIAVAARRGFVSPPIVRKSLHFAVGPASNVRMTDISNV